MSASQTATFRPRVSVVIPCYNYAQYLDACLVSVLGQEGVDTDVTIVDDASTDGSQEIARRWAANDPRVRLIAHEQNRRHIQTFNDALDAATAPYLVKLDPDDLLTPGSLLRSATVLAANPSAGFVYGPVIKFKGEPPQPPADSVTPKVRLLSGRKWLARRLRYGQNVITQPEIMIRREALVETGGHDPRVPEASDFHLWLRIATRWDVAVIEGPAQGMYRVHEQSMMRTIHAGTWRDFDARRRVFEHLLDEEAAALPERDALRRLAERTMSREALLWALDAYDSGHAGNEPIDDYVRDALALDPAVTRTRRWRELDRARQQGPGYTTPKTSLARQLRLLRFNHHLYWLLSPGRKW